MRPHQEENISVPADLAREFRKASPNMRERALTLMRRALHDDLPITDINAASSSFAFLADDPDIYTAEDLKERNV